MEGGCILWYEAVQKETAKTAAEEQMRMTGGPLGYDDDILHVFP